MPKRRDDLVERALGLIGPKLEQTEEARKKVAEAIALIKSAHRPTENQRELRQIASSLRRAIAALKKPCARSLQLRLHLSRNPGLAGLALAGPLVDRLPTLREELAGLASAANAAGKNIKRGRRQPHAKRCAAIWAHELLRSHGIQPTCYAQGKFFKLAAALYEGGTGIADADLDRVCTQVFRSHRPVFGIQLPPLLPLK